jgi:hypothetical protein
MDTAPSPTGSSTHQCLVDLDVGFLSPSDPVLIWTYHPGPQLVEDLEGCFVAGQT